MTRTQKIVWLANADTDTLLRQFEVSVRKADNWMELVKNYEEYTLEEIFEDLELVKEEIKRRLEK